MQNATDTAIVLKSIAYGERHRVVTALTRNHGKISAIARNSIHSRRFGGALGLFAVSDWTFYLKAGTPLYQITEAQIREPFAGLSTDFENLALASTFTELILKLAPEGSVCSELFSLHYNALQALSQKPSAPQLRPSQIYWLNAYLIKLLQWSGHQPDLQNCWNCKQNLVAVPLHQEIYCLIAEATWLCANCHFHHKATLPRAAMSLTPQAMNDLRLYMSVPIRQILEQTRASRKDHLEVFAFLETLITYHLVDFDPTSFKSLRFLDLESNEPPPRGRELQSLPAHL